jgi:hypothetical protein
MLRVKFFPVTKVGSVKMYRGRIVTCTNPVCFHEANLGD